MKTFVSDKKDFESKPIWNLEGLHERQNYGFWEAHPVGDIPNNYALLWRCSACKDEDAATPTWYCSNCGAMMLNKADIDAIDKRYMEVLKNVRAD